MHRCALNLGLITGLTIGLAAMPARSDICVDRPTADALAEAASELIRKGDYRQACANYHKSARLDPNTRRYLKLAECQERVGMTASAWLTFAEARDRAEERGEKDLAAIARQSAGRLEGALIRVAIVAPEASEVAGLEIRRDGALVPPAALGVAVPIDPGPHVITAKAPGRQTWSTQIAFVPGKTTVTVIVPNLSDDQPERTARR
jgi:hypothetical protein